MQRRGVAADIFHPRRAKKHVKEFFNHGKQNAAGVTFGGSTGTAQAKKKPKMTFSWRLCALGLLPLA